LLQLYCINVRIFGPNTTYTYGHTHQNTYPTSNMFRHPQAINLHSIIQIHNAAMHIVHDTAIQEIKK
jgi:hypothetical protein